MCAGQKQDMRVTWGGSCGSKGRPSTHLALTIDGLQSPFPFVIHNQLHTEHESFGTRAVAVLRGRSLASVPND